MLFFILFHFKRNVNFFIAPWIGRDDNSNVRISHTIGILYAAAELYGSSVHMCVVYTRIAFYFVLCHLVVAVARNEGN